MPKAAWGLAPAKLTGTVRLSPETSARPNVTAICLLPPVSPILLAGADSVTVVASLSLISTVALLVDPTV